MDMDIENRSGVAASPVGLIIRQKDPNNLEMPFDELGDFITPSELFYIRSHFPELPKQISAREMEGTANGMPGGGSEFGRGQMAYQPQVPNADGTMPDDNVTSQNPRIAPA